MARRSLFDPLELTSEPRWYVVRNIARGQFWRHVCCRFAASRSGPSCALPDWRV